MQFNTRRNRLAAAVASALAMSQSPVAVSQDTAALEEVLVTATRRATSVQDIPYSITAISSEAVSNAGASDLTDVLRIIPGVAYMDSGARGNSVNSTVILRGLNVASQAGDSTAFPNLSVPSVSTYVDETPVFINLKLTDLERVEVLRGPQGTLYGSGSLAGTLRFIHNKPNTEGVEGGINGSIETLGESDDQTYKVDGFVNIPLTDRAALRLSGAFEDAGGVIDADRYRLDSSGTALLENPDDFLGSGPALERIDDADTAEIYAIRAALGVDITDNLDILLSWHHQNIQGEGDNFRTIGEDYVNRFVFSDDLDNENGPRGDMVPNSAYLNTIDQTADVANLTLNWDVGFATLTSSTSYVDVETDTTRDASSIQFNFDRTNFCYIYGCYPRGPFIGEEPSTRKDFTQELRLVSNSEGAIDWVLGGFYADQEATFDAVQTISGFADWANTEGSGDFAGVGGTWADYLAGFATRPDDPDRPYQYLLDRETEFEDIAIFGELTYHATEKWQITVGARQFWQKYSSSQITELPTCGLFCGPNTAGRTEASRSDDESDAIFKFNTSYDFTEDTRVYFTWAEGFRRGGANGLPEGAFGITAEDLTYKADKTTNYELGFKGSLGDGKAIYTIAAFAIDWEDPQVDTFLTDAGLPAVINAGEAESRGIEVEVNGVITDNWSYSLGYNWLDTELKDRGRADYLADAVIGAALPGSAEHQFNFATDYILPLSDSGMDLHFHLNGVYKGEAWNDFEGLENGFQLDSFWLVNGAITLGSQSWQVGLFVDNIFDEQDAVWSADLRQNLSVAAPARPRSYGLRASYRF